MSEMNDFKIFEKSRQAAEDFFDASLVPTWKQMETKLDEEMPVEKKKRRVVIFWLLFLGLLSGGIITGIQMDKNLNRRETSFSNQDKPKINTDKLNNTGSNNTRFTNTKQQHNQNTYTPDTLKETKARFKNEKEEIVNTEFSVEKAVDKKAVKYKTKGKQAIKITSPDIVSNESLTKEVFNADTAEKTNPDYESKDFMIAFIDSNTDNVKNINDSFTSKPKIDTVNTVPNTNSSVANKSKNSKMLLIGLSAGLNFNHVRYNNFSSPGYDVALVAGYRLSPKLELRAGINFSKKHFNANGKAMAFDSAKLNLPSYNSINLEAANGYCRFTELPLMLFYYLPEKNNLSLLVGAGLSVNRMRMENVNYTFKTDAGAIIQRSHSGMYHNMETPATSYTANISLGVRYKISPRLYFSIEPYVKLPINKINNINLKITTLGSSVSIFYNPFKTK